MAFNLEEFNLDFEKRMSLYQKELVRNMLCPGTRKMRLLEKRDRVRSSLAALREKLQRKEESLRETEGKCSRRKEEMDELLKLMDARMLCVIKEMETDRAEITKLKEEYATLERNLFKRAQNAEKNY